MDKGLKKDKYLLSQKKKSQLKVGRFCTLNAQVGYMQRTRTSCGIMGDLKHNILY